MKNIIIAQQNRDLRLLGYFGSENLCGEGTYRVIYKCKAGFISSNDVGAKSAYDVFRTHKMKHVNSIEFVTKSGHALTIYSRVGKKVWITEELLAQLTVGDINGNNLVNTALYSQFQYNAVKAKTWADKAYVMNEVEEMVA